MPGLWHANLESPDFLSQLHELSALIWKLPNELQNIPVSFLLVTTIMVGACNN